MSRVVTIINQSTQVSTTALDTFIGDLNTALSTSFRDAWGLDGVVGIGGVGYPVLLLDQPQAGDPKGALGFHDLDSNFQVYARCFVQFAEQQGVPWSVVVSHEIFEMLVDPLVNQATFLDAGNGQGYIIYEEVADPCELQYSKGAQGSPISNFVFPGWYVPGYPGKVDNLGLLDGPLQIASGGYADYDIVFQSSGVLQALGSKKSTRRVQQDLI